MTKNIIKGIDEVIKGLTTIKGALLAQGEAPVIAEAVKEAVKEVLPDNIHKESEELINAKVDKSPREKAQEAVATVENNMDDRRAELQEMKYNDLKALAGTLEGVSAKGKKDELIEKILVAELALEDAPEGDEEVENQGAEGEGQEVSEESEDGDTPDDEDGDEESEFTEEDEADFVEFLESLELDEIKEISKEAGYKVTSKSIKDKLIQKLVSDLDVLYATLEEMGYYDEEEGEEAPEDTQDDDDQEVDKDSIIEEYGLNDMKVEELADICTEFDLSTKGKKQALIDRIVVGIIEGTIELEFEEDEEDEQEEAPKEEKKSLKRVAEHSNPEVAEAEAKIDEDIRAKYPKKLKDSAIKKFLDNYFDGNPEHKDMSKEEMLELYIDIHKSLVDDDGDVIEMEEPYERNEEYHCCGRVLKDLDNDDLYCSVCGNEYEA